jgi:hypothetical protein
MVDIFTRFLQVLSVVCYAESIAFLCYIAIKTQGFYVFRILDFIAKIILAVHPIKYGVDHYDIYVPNNPFLVLTSNAAIPDEPRISSTIEFIYMREEEEYPTYRVVYQWHILYDAEDRKKYIGLVIEVMDDRLNVVYCLDVLMNARSFFRFPIQLLKTHLLDTVMDAETDADLPLMVASDLCRLVGDYGLMDVPSNPIVFKTRWISVIQRRWRCKYAERMRLLLLRRSLAAQRQFELCGKYGIVY